MKLLLDTHVLLWWMTSDRRLTKGPRAAIADRENEVAVSAASFWEVAIKKRLGRIDVDLEELAQAAESSGFTELPVATLHTIELATLPAHHSDPFDRMLIAQAIVEKCQLVTRDETILSYAGVRGLAMFAI